MAIITGLPVKGQENRIKVVSICYTTDKPISEKWITVRNELIPEYPQVDIGKTPVMYFDTDKHEFDIEIVDRDLTTIERKDKEIEELRTLLEESVSLLIETGVL